MQVAAAAYEPQRVPQDIQGAGHDASCRTGYVPMTGDEADRPETWSALKAYLTTGVAFSGYEANEFGGAQRRLPLFHQDRANCRCSGEVKCAQVHQSRKQLGPGLSVRSQLARAYVDVVDVDAAQHITASVCTGLLHTHPDLNCSVKIDMVLAA